MRMFIRIVFCLCLFHIVVFKNLNASHYEIETVNMTFPLWPKTKALSKRYPDEFKNKSEFFTREEEREILSNKLEPLINSLIFHKDIILPSAENILAFARAILESGHSFKALEEHIVYFIQQRKEVPFTALEKAVDRLERQLWKHVQLLKTNHENDDFINNLKILKLEEEDHNKLVKINSYCVKPFGNKNDRQRFLTPKICKPDTDYPKPRHEKKPLSMHNERSEKTFSNKRAAYELFLVHAADVAKTEELSIFEKMLMAKCVAEQALRFFEPLHHPLKALSKSRNMSLRSPEHEFFAHSGVCSNFAGIAYNVSQALFLHNRVFLARKGFHVYLEFKDYDNKWYHMHPFNSANKDCDMMRFN
jgi:hypothetical protein